ncbi:hypothetical protein DLJ47_05675, partial [Micromonospora sp. S4605]
METVLYHQFLIDVPRAAAIWSGLLVLALTVLTVLVARPEPATDEEPAPAAAEPAEPDLADLRRYAEEVAVAATRAAQTARRRRADWLAAQAEVERAWQAYD